MATTQATPAATPGTATPPVPVFYSGTLPGPDGAVADQLNNPDINVLRQRAIDFYQFWVNDAK